MSVRRVMGIETEYGVTLAGQPGADPVLLSGQVVRSYTATAGPARALPTGSGWDYADETPLRDARGYTVARALAHVSQLTDEDDPAVANSVLSNGARLYVDHAHPEYSSPEVLTPRQAVTWDRAGELVMAQAAQALAAQGRPVRLYKNNVDGKGASYGTHENYLVPRSVPFEALVRGLLPFFATRQVVTGAGRVGLGEASERPGFQLSQRADYIEAEVGLETTLRRPLVNTRDEPHASADRYRRLHVIIGDANVGDVATLLKTGLTSLVLRLVEAGRAPDVDLADPVAAVRAVSHDPALQVKLELRDGRRMTALDVLAAYREAVGAALDAGVPGFEDDEDTREVLELWDEVTGRLAADPMGCTGLLDWVTKYALLQGYRDRDGMGWEDPRLAAIDIQWSDVDPARGLGVRMRAAGRLRSLVAEEAVRAAVTDPPDDTRAFFRGRCVSRYAGQVRAASWDSVVFAAGPAGGLRRVELPEPLLGTRATHGDLLAGAADPDALLAALADTAG